MKTKKKYNKPQLTQVRLVIQSPILASCATTNSPNWEGDLDCSLPGAACADTSLGL